MTNIQHENLQSGIFAGGCFWCVEADFKKRPSIKDIESGYIGGKTDDPSYETAAKHGHREAVRVWFDPEETNYRELVAYFFTIHDPTDAGGSFADRGHTYTSAIYYQNEDQKQIAEDVIEALDQAGVFDERVVTEVVPADRFWLAEEYHQEYAKKSADHYKVYRKASGRDDFIKKYKNDVYEALDM